MMPPGAFRLLLAGVVVVHHSFPLRLGNCAVGVFFLLSGYWISRMWNRKYSRQERPYRTFLASRWWRLAPLFLTVQILGVLLVQAGYPVGASQALEDWRWWATQPTIVGSVQFGRLLPPSWSLDVEMQFYLIAPLLILLATRARIGGQIALLAVMFLWSLGRFAIGVDADTAQLDLFLWLFFAGILSEQLDFRPSRRMAMASLAAVVALVAVMLIQPSTRELIWKRGLDGPADPIRSGLFFLTASALAAPLAISTVHKKSGTFDRWLGDLSYPLYLFHWFTRDWYYAHVDWSQPAWQPAALLMVNFALAVLGAVLLLHLIDRPAQQMRSRWQKSRRESPAVEPVAAVANEHV